MRWVYLYLKSSVPTNHIWESGITKKCFQIFFPAPKSWFSWCRWGRWGKAGYFDFEVIDDPPSLAYPIFLFFLQFPFFHWLLYNIKWPKKRGQCWKTFFVFFSSSSIPISFGSCGVCLTSTQSRDCTAQWALKAIPRTKPHSPFFSPFWNCFLLFTVTVCR